MQCIIVGYDVREPVEVRILKDRIEISSYPGLERSVPTSAMQDNNIRGKKYRNRRIGDFLKELKLTEGRNTGIPKIKRALENNGSPAPIFETDDDRTYFITTILIHEGFKKDTENIPKSIPKSIPKNISKTQSNILSLIQDNDIITQQDLSKQLNLSLPSIKKNIKILKELGILSRKGSNRNGRWIILDEIGDIKKFSQTFNTVDEMFEDLDKN